MATHTEPRSTTKGKPLVFTIQGQDHTVASYCQFRGINQPESISRIQKRLHMHRYHKRLTLEASAEILVQLVTRYIEELVTPPEPKILRKSNPPRAGRHPHARLFCIDGKWYTVGEYCHSQGLTDSNLIRKIRYKIKNQYRIHGDDGRDWSQYLVLCVERRKHEQRQAAEPANLESPLTSIPESEAELRELVQICAAAIRNQEQLRESCNADHRAQAALTAQLQALDKTEQKIEAETTTKLHELMETFNIQKRMLENQKQQGLVELNQKRKRLSQELQTANIRTNRNKDRVVYLELLIRQKRDEMTQLLVAQPTQSDKEN